MEYNIKIDKYVKDRFKIYKEEKEEPVYIGEKVGDSASYFDAFIGETFSKGANFVFFDKEKNEVLKVERNFYDMNKEYKLLKNQEELGSIKSKVEDKFIEIDIKFYDLNKHISFNKENKVFELENIGKIKSLRQGFRNYEEMSIEIIDEKYEILLIAIAVYIWDVFIKNKTAFVF
ncbi:MAG: hypothetical protein WAO56_11300 [Miniphocaeibacter sp.]|uniref:hypothetical protein n=1 Tax=Miniphocaeibacter sp. TaxID=3100973 RepID=UPI00180BC9D7|nr:hypothetical protein [Gallicola sp.]